MDMLQDPEILIVFHDVIRINVIGINNGSWKIQQTALKVH